jgi:hypothetical protein
MVRIVNHPGGLAQLARASALHAEGQGFDSLILHQKEVFNRKPENKKINSIKKFLKYWNNKDMRWRI